MFAYLTTIDTLELPIQFAFDRLTLFFVHLFDAPQNSCNYMSFTSHNENILWNGGETEL